MANQEILSKLNHVFNSRFGEPAFIARSPGRINLIGEHTDYNMGFVLPASIDKAIYIVIGERNDNRVHLVAADLGDSYETDLGSLHQSGKHWPDYVLGVVDQLQQAGHQLRGFNAALAGDVPLGAGLSSSAAVECATAFALDKLFNLGLDRKTMVQLSQKAENEFVGVKCGIMDQFASMFGRPEQLIRLDCRSLAYEYIPFPTKDIEILLLDTGVKHSLASSEYNLRRQECEEGVRIIAQQYPEVQSLRDATIAMVEQCLANGDSKVYRRCLYVVQEIKRLQDACMDLTANDLRSFGKKMFETHKGLSELYEVSCPEADALVSMAGKHDSVYGARMMGGGFGGCTINIVARGAADALVRELQPLYQQQFNRQLKAYKVRIDEGSSLVN
ncbi:MAG: galactokinase [Chitinophagaceae bacterium]|nr:galactokinase [Chitinophagaceae bacterium]